MRREGGNRASEEERIVQFSLGSEAEGKAEKRPDGLRGRSASHLRRGSLPCSKEDALRLMQEEMEEMKRQGDSYGPAMSASKEAAKRAMEQAPEVPGQVSLVPCPKCGRTFFPERLEKHEAKCDGPSAPPLRKSSISSPEQPELARRNSEMAYSPDNKPGLQPCPRCGRFFLHFRLSEHMAVCQYRNQHHPQPSSPLDPPGSSHEELLPCETCGRKFFPSRLAAHKKHCGRQGSGRFDDGNARADGTEGAKARAGLEEWALNRRESMVKKRGRAEALRRGSSMSVAEEESRAGESGKEEETDQSSAHTPEEELVSPENRRLSTSGGIREAPAKRLSNEKGFAKPMLSPGASPLSPLWDGSEGASGGGGGGGGGFDDKPLPALHLSPQTPTPLQPTPLVKRPSPSAIPVRVASPRQHQARVTRLSSGSSGDNRAAGLAQHRAGGKPVPASPPPLRPATLPNPARGVHSPRQRGSPTTPRQGARPRGVSPSSPRHRTAPLQRSGSGSVAPRVTSAIPVRRGTSPAPRPRDRSPASPRVASPTTPRARGVSPVRRARQVASSARSSAGSAPGDVPRRLSDIGSPAHQAPRQPPGSPRRTPHTRAQQPPARQPRVGQQQLAPGHQRAEVQRLGSDGSLAQRSVPHKRLSGEQVLYYSAPSSGLPRDRASSDLGPKTPSPQRPSAPPSPATLRTPPDPNVVAVAATGASINMSPGGSAWQPGPPPQLRGIVVYEGGMDDANILGEVVVGEDTLVSELVELIRRELGRKGEFQIKKNNIPVPKMQHARRVLEFWRSEEDCAVLV